MVPRRAFWFGRLLYLHNDVRSSDELLCYWFYLGHCVSVHISPLGFECRVIGILTENPCSTSWCSRISLEYFPVNRVWKFVHIHTFLHCSTVIWSVNVIGWLVLRPLPHWCTWFRTLIFVGPLGAFITIWNYCVNVNSEMVKFQSSAYLRHHLSEYFTHTSERWRLCYCVQCCFDSNTE